MQCPGKQNKTAIWTITPKAEKLAAELAAQLPLADIFTSKSLKQSLPQVFHEYQAHIFIMSTGIAVRMIAPHIRDKTTDPAVVVMDELGLHAISLVSGHLGGANALALELAHITGADPVITTATDLNKVPAIDLIAKENNLFIENPSAIKYISMALLTGQKIWIHDPHDFIKLEPALISPLTHDIPGIYVDDILSDLPPKTLILRPKSLAAGIGCNRNTGAEEIKALLLETMDKYMLSINSLKTIASVDIKNDEPGLISLAEDLGIPLIFFDRQALKDVINIENPSKMVEKHIGIQSVCEAAAILAAGSGKLIVPKQKTKNATLAVARISRALP
ncbi:Cobalamin biosynthesis protein [Desulfonema limicola]|uniref:Cobalamin biosynthesis protein n=1 Tax=Desulfonema limicola TaxID=45656 RepID=A0A975GJ22_9BACT|nr:cobalt-precorrin 5A hydrolase [Desulfonema limicola]QTA83066.1 Cobalamin biosynthesis protein [Desulfonema limicola]